MQKIFKNSCKIIWCNEIVTLSLIYQKQIAMTTATLNISKSLTKMVTTSFGTLISSYKLGQLNIAVADLKSFDFTGTAKASKFSKYEEVLLNAGFCVSEVLYSDNAGFEGANSDVINFRVVYAKA